jgi:hypothetical protein
MEKFKQIRAKLYALRMGHGTDRRPPEEHLLEDTLKELEALEADFRTICREVAILSTDYHSKTYATSREFDEACDRRGVVLPDLA